MTLEKVFELGHCGAWRKSGGTILDVVPNDDIGGYDLHHTGEIIRGGDRTETEYAIEHFESLEEIDGWEKEWKPSEDCECPICEEEVGK